VAGCVFNATPEDFTQPTPVVGGIAVTTAGEVSSLIDNFAVFMRLNAAPVPATPPGVDPATVAAGQTLFDVPANGGIGCALCHSTSLTSGQSPFGGMSAVTYHPYSDFALHHMGSTLTDGITQGVAGPDEFRTAPLWGIGQRIFFLHDGRTSDLMAAIQAHASSSGCVSASPVAYTFQVNGTQFTMSPPGQSFCGSEANGVIAALNALSTAQQQDILNFLRSL